MWVTRSHSRSLIGGNVGGTGQNESNFLRFGYTNSQRLCATNQIISETLMQILTYNYP